jgi:predicted deacylase
MWDLAISSQYQKTAENHPAGQIIIYPFFNPSASKAKEHFSKGAKRPLPHFSLSSSET